MSYDAALRQMVRSASLHACLLLVGQALSRSGFGDVQLLDRRAPRQRSRLGGCELMCRTSVGGLPIRVIVKVVKDTLRVRMLDEMAGAIDRTGSDLGIVVTTEDLPAALAGASERYRKSRVEAVGLAGLARMLRQHGVGVRPSGEPDYAFFEELEGQLERVSRFLADEPELV